MQAWKMSRKNTVWNEIETIFKSRIYNELQEKQTLKHRECALVTFLFHVCLVVPTENLL